MRPNSRGSIGSSAGMNSAASGLPPGTSRPGSKGLNRPPGTSARLRTGVAQSGPGTVAAGGIALQTSVNVSDRPVTGQGMMGMKSKGLNNGRLVEDSAYYIGLLRKRIGDATAETQRLRTEYDQNSKDNSQYSQLERKYESLLKNKETLEGQLADYNLALDKTRTHADAEDVQHLANHLYEKNRQTGQELDRIFTMKKQKEDETADIEEKIDVQYQAIEGKLNVNEDIRRNYHDLLGRQRELQERNLTVEARLNEFNSRISQMESDDKSTAYRKEYNVISKKMLALRKDSDNLQEELDIAGLDPKEAHAKFMARVNDLKKLAKDLDEKLKGLNEDIKSDKRTLEDLVSSTASTVEDQSEMAKYELLVKRDQEMTAFMDQFEETRGRILDEQRRPREMIIALLEHLSKGIDESTNLPSQAALGEMEEAKSFKEKNLITAQKTMEGLGAEHKKLKRDLEGLNASEPKLKAEVETRRLNIDKMKKEIKDFEDIAGLREAFEDTRNLLKGLKEAYGKKKDNMRQQIQGLSAENESLKKLLASNEIAKEIDENEKRLKQNERTVFELKEFIDVKGRETDFEAVKGNCLKMIDRLNAAIIKDCQGSGVFNNNAQAKY